MWISRSILYTLAAITAAAYAQEDGNSNNATTTTTTTASTNKITPSSSSGPLPQSSPAWLSDVKVLPGNVDSYPVDASKIPTGPFSSNSNITLQGYPSPGETPSIQSPQVQAVIKAIDWSQVPKASIRKADNDGNLQMKGYNEASDPSCWWSATGCVKPKFSGLPEDIYYCPKPGDWGLTYDDGPLTQDEGKEAAEPHLYNFLAEHQQKAALFYIGANVLRAPLAAQRALADGHTLCSHTWSHPAMTSLSNEQVVAELYWTLRVIKEVAGVTVKCWRPPYGDVDDRVRAIAWQMGMRTVLWDQDTEDWSMPGPGGGSTPPATIDSYFENWINARKNGTDNENGHVILQHELNAATVQMAEKWLPKIKETFNVVPFHQCMNISRPYWEENFVIPTEQDPNPTKASNNNATSNNDHPSGSSTSSSSDPSEDKDSDGEDGEESAAAAVLYRNPTWSHILASATAPLIWYYYY